MPLEPAPHLPSGVSQCSLISPAADRVRYQQYQVDIGAGGMLRCAFSGTQDLLFLLLQREVGCVVLCACVRGDSGWGERRGGGEGGWVRVRAFGA